MRRAVAAALGDAELGAARGGQRAALLGPYASGDAVLPASAEEGNERLDAVFEALADARARHGTDALGAYIVGRSRTSRADVLTVLALARRGGLIDDAGRVPLDIAPLFETIDDWDMAPMCCATCSPIRSTGPIWPRGNVQMVMLGYSDSGKDGGIAASR